MYKGNQLERRFQQVVQTRLLNGRGLVIGISVALLFIGGGAIVAHQAQTRSRSTIEPATTANLAKEYVYLGNRIVATEEPAGTAPDYVGFVDVSTCDTIGGWAADRNRLNTVINASIYDGNNLIAIVQAKFLRSDVAAFLGDNGLHGINFPTPAALRDGATHTVHVKFENSSVELTGSPFSLTCPAITPDYVGYVDVATCSSLGGWVADRNRLNTPISVSIYDGSTLILTTRAGMPRSDVAAFLGDNGSHGFSVATPPQLLTGTHTIHFKFETGTQELTGGSPVTLTCP